MSTVGLYKRYIHAKKNVSNPDINKVMDHLGAKNLLKCQSVTYGIAQLWGKVDNLRKTANFIGSLGLTI